jgi:hypothetical protein
MLAAWFLMLCLGFVIAKSVEVAAAPTLNNDTESAACYRSCFDSTLSPAAVVQCQSDCDRRFGSGKTGLAIKPSNKALSTAPISKQGLQRRGVEPESPTGNQEKAQQGDKKE